MEGRMTQIAYMPVEIFLTVAQKAVLKQFADEEWTGIVAAIPTASDDVKCFSVDADAMELGEVLYETDKSGVDGLAKVEFGGIIASAAVW